MRRSSVALLPLAAGLAWLAYKAEYLALGTPSALTILIVSPGAALLVASAFVAFPDAPRRVAGALVTLGLVAAQWTCCVARPQGGWTFYTPIASMYSAEGPLSLETASPSLVAATLLLPVGLALFLRRSPFGAAFVGAAFWLFVGFPPELGAVFGDEGMPRRYHYYYRSERQSGFERGQRALSAVLTLAGVALLARRKPIVEKGADPSGSAPSPSDECGS